MLASQAGRRSHPQYPPLQQPPLETLESLTETLAETLTVTLAETPETLAETLAETPETSVETVETLETPEMRCHHDVRLKRCTQTRTRTGARRAVEEVAAMAPQVVAVVVAAAAAVYNHLEEHHLCQYQGEMAMQRKVAKDSLETILHSSNRSSSSTSSVQGCMPLGRHRGTQTTRTASSMMMAPVQVWVRVPVSVPVACSH